MCVTGSIALVSGAEIPDITPSLNLRFQLSGYTASGVRVHRVDCYGEVIIFIFKYPFTNTHNLGQTEFPDTRRISIGKCIIEEFWHFFECCIYFL